MTIMSRGHLLRYLTLVLGATLLAAPIAAQARCDLKAVGTHALHYCARGRGDPIVVLAAGTGQTSRSFDNLAAELAHLGTTITFDRAGMGESPPGPSPRTPTANATELRLLLDVVAGGAPLILVGHSAGGWQMLRLAAISDNVAGVVLIDTPPIDFEERRMSLLTPSEQSVRKALLEEAARRAPSVVREEREAAQQDIARGFDDFPRTVPLIVIAANGQDFGAGSKNVGHRQLWIEMSRAWTVLSEFAEFTIANGSSHMVHQDQPTIVIDAIERLVERATMQ